MQDTDETTVCHFFKMIFVSIPPPAVVQFYDPVLVKFVPFESACPQTHFQCPDNGYCLPVFFRCNGVNDCPAHEDEAGCDSATCPGFYRCRSSSVCLHPSTVCDGVYQCPQKDDELFCNLTCPAGCTCHGLDFACHEPVVGQLNSGVRYMDASGSDLTLERLEGKTMLIHISLSGCWLKTLHNETFPNLLSLDLSGNQLHSVTTDYLLGLLNLRYLSLSKNPLKSLFSQGTDQPSFPALATLDVSGVRMQEVNTASFSHFPGLQTLNLSHCAMDLVTGEGLHATSKLRVVDFVGSPMTQFPRDFLTGLVELRAVHADNFKLCCPGSLPVGFNPANCKAPFNEVSSCESLLRSDIYVVFLSVFSALALLGNLGCFLTRSVRSKSSATGFGVFVTHLSISDFLMGVYLATIGVADRLFKGSYIWQDVYWRQSTACEMAGFLSMLSNEVSAFIICLITLDRFLVLRFPFSSLHFKGKSAHITCVVVWVVFVVIAALPIMPMTSHWSFYGQTGIYVPLPVSRSYFAGRDYAFGVMIVFNFILFLFIAVGQAAIYVSVQANSMRKADSTKKSADLRIARRLISVAVSDFLCWFPIGLLGLLASTGVPIPGEINVGMAVLVLPLNSALNPFLYTINVLLERRESSRDDRLLKQLMAQVCEG